MSHRPSIEHPYSDLKYNIEKHLDASGKKNELVEKLIKASGRHRTQIHRYRGTHKSDKRDMPLTDAYIISRVLNISLEELLNVEPEPERVA